MRYSPFRPFDTAFDESQARNILKNTLHGGEDGELFLERVRSEAIALDDRHIKTATYNASSGFGLRAVSGETTGYAHSNELNLSALKSASETVRMAITKGDGVMAAAPQKTNKKLYATIDPVSDVEFSHKIDILRQIDDFARTYDSRVVQVSASILTNIQEIEILKVEGASYRDHRPLVRLNVSVTLEKNGMRETGTSGSGGRYDLNELLRAENWQAKIIEAIRIADVNLDAKPAPAGIMDVVLGSGWPGILLHEAVGHGLEGDYNRKNMSAFAGLMGKRIASKGVTVLDDGTLAKRRGSITIDDEGTSSQKTTLIEDGILVGLMQDRQNARLMGVEATGNGRRESFAHVPMPRMTNTYMLGGDAKRSDMIADMKDGIYAVGFGGGQVDITNGKFVFSCTEAYRVKDGKIGEPVKGATLVGDGATALKHIRAIGDDMALDPGMGTCGKAGQWVPVGVGQPSLMIGGLTIGGSEI